MTATRASGDPKYQPVDASPVKSFFVSMLTRDIQLADAILDLLDNCIDGILRSEKRSATSYKGYKAEITFDESHFSIHDNCGGIPWDLSAYAFRMGRPSDQPDRDLPMVGVYGIGMKRAVFKMGRHCIITTRSGKDNYEVEITPEWIADERAWEIPVKQTKQSMAEAGTTIYVGKLNEGIDKTFGDGAAAFQAELNRRVAEQYAFIIAKGFSVTINGMPVEPKPTRLVFMPPARGRKRAPSISPFVYRTRVEGVDVFLTIGLTRTIPTDEEIKEEDSGAKGKYSTLAAGWTVVCNDRAVVYCDRTELTGWGEGDIPRYHTQFIAISGIVEFRSNDASKLPTTTTKRGIDASSTIYLKVKNKMREGLRLFTKYTYWWKGREEEAREMISKGQAVTFAELKSRIAELRLRKVPRHPGGEQFMPLLPRPRRQESDMQRISFERPREQVRRVADYLLSDPEAPPKRVGEECFNRMHREAKK